MTLEPTGIGALNLQESLLAQYRELFGFEEDAETVIKDYFQYLPEPERLALETGISRERLEEIVSRIKSLKPYPTFYYSDETVHYIEPDVFVYDRGDRFEVVVNEKGIPKLKLTSAYRKLITDKTLPEETRNFLQQKLQVAMGIIKGIEQRRENLKKITEILVNYQSDFLRKGKEHLKPLILKDVAEHVGLHESTVSRIVSSKYIQTPIGVLPMKAFFSTRLSSAEGDVSAERVKHLIAKLIEEEDRKKPLSDQKIADILKSKGIKVARRTVTKYREQMNIPDSRTRREKR